MRSREQTDWAGVAAAFAALCLVGLGLVIAQTEPAARRLSPGAFEPPKRPDLVSARNLPPSALAQKIVREPGAMASVLQRAAARRWPPDRPFLRIEADQHTAPIRSIDADAAGRFIVTASWDKTARLWAAPDAAGESYRLVRVFRPPIGDSDEGKAYAVAISPDGGTVAVAGWIGATGEESDLGVYLFDRRTGAVLERLTLGEERYRVTQSLAFSPDGRRLAAGTQRGVVVWTRSPGGRRQWSAPRELAGEYGADTYGLSFAADGRLATTSFAGFVRLYDPDLRLRATARAPGGDQPLRIAFSPSGALLAIGYYERPTVSVLNAADLSLAYAPDTTGIVGGNLSKVVWSADGLYLFAAGRAEREDGRQIIRRFSLGGRGPSLDIGVSADTVQGMAALPDGRLAYGTADPLIGILEADGGLSAAATVSQPILDLRDSPFNAQRGLNALRVSPDGSIINLPTSSAGESRLSFDVNARVLTAETAEPAALAAPLLSAPGLTVRDWVNSAAPTLNGRRLPLEPYEDARALAVAPSGQGFLLGADFTLSLYDRTGEPVWTNATPSVAWRVNISADERLAIAAFGDGTVRWHRMSDGLEVLALYIAPDPETPRWIAWTPEGYYDASPGAEDLIGWHVNRGADQAALFFPASRFRAQFYRPDIIGRVLETLETGAPVSASALLRRAPPVLDIVNVEDNGDGRLVLELDAGSPSGEALTSVEVYVDDDRYELGDGARNVPTGRQNLEIRIDPCATEITVYVKTADGVSVPQSYYREPDPSCQAGPRKPNLYALIVGVSAYIDPRIRDLQYADDDARDIGAAFEAQKDRAFGDITSYVLANETATRDNIAEGLDWLRAAAKSGDVGMLFLAGHGMSDPQDRRYYYFAHDTDLDRLAATAIRGDDIQAAIRGVSGRKLVFIDTCYADDMENGGLQITDINGLTNRLGSSETRGVAVFSSSTGVQLSSESDAWRNGAFTEALLEGLSGAADLPPGVDSLIDEVELFRYVKFRVEQLTDKKQTPAFTSRGSISPVLAELD